MAEIHWLNPVDGNFDTASDWSGGVVPGKTDDAFLDAPGETSYTVTLTVGDVVNTLYVDSTATLSIADDALSALQGANNSGAIIVGQSAFFESGAAGSGGFENTGALYVEKGASIELNNTINNSGLILMESRYSMLYFAFPSFATGGGIIHLLGSRIEGSPYRGGVSFTNVNNIIEGYGRFSEYLYFTNDTAGIVDADARSPLVLNVRNLTITNAGLIEATNGGDCVIDSAVSNTGALAANGGTLTLDAAVTGSGVVDVIAGTVVVGNAGAAEAVTFTGKKGALELDRSQTYAGSVSGFSAKGKTELDLRDIGFVSASEATFSGSKTSGVLTVTDGTHTARITLEGDYDNATFVASSDGKGGVDIVAASGQTPSVAHFAAAMATLTGHGAAPGPIHRDDTWKGHPPMLAGPRGAIA